MTTRRSARRERLDVRGTVLLIERRVVLLLPHRRSQMLGTGAIQHVEVSCRALQRIVVCSQIIVVRSQERVVVNRANVAHVDAAVIHARLAELADRRRTLHLTAKVRRPLMHLLGTAKVLSTTNMLGATKVLGTSNAPDVSATHVSATHVSTTHVSTAETATAHVPATDVASSHVPPASTTASSVAVAGRQALQAEQ